MFVSLDLETTGFDPIRDKIIEFGALKFDFDKEHERLQFLINPGIQIPQIVTHITGIKDNDLKSAAPVEEKLDRIKNFIGDLPIIGHNIQFDTEFLRQNGLTIENPEYDTQQLAGILLPNLPSYSLEILTQILDLKHQEKHRALDDAVAAMELFLKLMAKIKTLPKEILYEVKNLCAKSDWPLKTLIQGLESRNPKPLNSQRTLKPSQKTENSPSKKVLKSQGNAILEVAPPYNQLIIDLSINASPDTYISLPYHLFREIEPKISDTAGKIDVPENYLSEKRLQTLAQKQHFENHELTGILKFTIWKHSTKTGLLSEVSLFGEEKTIIPKINIDESISSPLNEKFYKKALDKDKNAPAVCTHRFLMENPGHINRLILVDYEKFAKSVHFGLSAYLRFDIVTAPLLALKEINPQNQTIESLLSKCTILFGLLGIIFEKTNDRNEFISRSIIGENIQNSKEWHDAQKCLQGLIGNSQELGEIKTGQTLHDLKKWKKYLEDLSEILNSPPTQENLIFLEQDFHKNIVLRKIPLNYGPAVQKILEKCENYQIISEDADLSCPDLAIEKRRLGKKPENLEILIINDISDDSRAALPHMFKSYFDSTGKKIAIIANSRKQLEYLTLKLSRSEVPVISQLTASLGKLTEQFKNSDRSILILTPNFWEKFELNDQIDTLFIDKLPFDPPSEPFLLALSQGFQDPFNELQVKRAILNLKNIINRLTTSPLQSKQAVILDSRVITKGYGSRFIEKLQEMAPVSDINLKNFHH